MRRLAVSSYCLSYRVLSFQLAEAGKNIDAVMIRTWHPLAIDGMHHVSLRVRDLEPSLAFYRDISVMQCNNFGGALAFFPGPDGELIELLEDKTGYT